MMRSIGRSRGLRALSVLASACALALTAVLSPVAPLLPPERRTTKLQLPTRPIFRAILWRLCTHRDTRERA